MNVSQNFPPCWPYENDNIAFNTITEFWWSDNKEKNKTSKQVPIPVEICPPHISYENSCEGLRPFTLGPRDSRVLPGSSEFIAQLQ